MAGDDGHIGFFPIDIKNAYVLKHHTMNAHVQFVFHRLFLRRKALLIYPMLSYVHWWQRKNAHKLKLNLAKIFHMRIFSNNFFFIVVLICVIGKTESSISQSSMTNIIVVVCIIFKFKRKKREMVITSI